MVLPLKRIIELTISLICWSIRPSIAARFSVSGTFFGVTAYRSILKSWRRFSNISSRFYMFGRSLPLTFIWYLTATSLRCFSPQARRSASVLLLSALTTRLCFHQALMSKTASFLSSARYLSLWSSTKALAWECVKREEVSITKTNWETKNMPQKLAMTMTSRPKWVIG